MHCFSTLVFLIVHAGELPRRQYGPQHFLRLGENFLESIKLSTSRGCL